MSAHDPPAPIRPLLVHEKSVLGKGSFEDDLRDSLGEADYTIVGRLDPLDRGAALGAALALMRRNRGQLAEILERLELVIKEAERLELANTKPPARGLELVDYYRARKLLDPEERARAWLRVYGTDRVPILSPDPELAHVDGLGVCSVFLVDVAALEPSVVVRLVEHIATAFEVGRDQVRADLAGHHGIPLPAQGLSIETVGGRFFACLNPEPQAS